MTGATMTVDALSEEAMEHLSSRARRHHRSPAAEARAILEAQLADSPAENGRPAAPPAIDRRKAVDRIFDLQHRLTAKYGEMPDSTDLIREDRAR